MAAKTKEAHPHRCECKHAKVKFCADCKLVHCLDCKTEWAAAPCTRSHNLYPGLQWNSLSGVASSPKFTVGQLSATPEPLFGSHITQAVQALRPRGRGRAALTQSQCH